MRKVIVLIVGALFLHGLLRDMTFVRILMFCAAIASALAVSRIPSELLLRGKYPLIGLCLALCPIFFFYPALRPLQCSAGAAILTGFYGLAFFLVTVDEKAGRPYKEVIGLTLLYGATVFNLFLTRHTELVLPLSVAILIFLFVVNRAKMMPYLIAYSAGLIIFFVAKGAPVFAPYAPLRMIEQYFVLGCAFVLFLMTLIALMKKPDFASILAFFGLLYVSVDLLISVGLKLNGVMLYQPVLALCIMGPLLGVIMKGGQKRT